jgi:hypothetical protein
VLETGSAVTSIVKNDAQTVEDTKTPEGTYARSLKLTNSSQLAGVVRF